MDPFFPLLVVVLTLGNPLLPVSGSQLSKNTELRLVPSSKMTLADTSSLSDVQYSSAMDRSLLQEPAGGGPQQSGATSGRPAECGNIQDADRTLFWNRTEMGFLFVPDWPKSCEDLEKRDLTECTEDMNTKNGCCDRGCLDVLQKVPQKCWNDLAKEMCSAGLTNEVKLMDGLGRRCLPKLGPFSCKDCDVKPKKTSNAEVEAKLGNLALVEVPEGCGEFSALDMLTCEKDLEVEAGCCEEPCLNLLDLMNDECWIEFNENACKSSNTASLVELMNVLSKRCDTLQRPVSCKENKFSTPLTLLEGNDDTTESKSEESTAAPDGEAETSQGFEISMSLSTGLFGILLILSLL